MSLFDFAAAIRARPSGEQTSQLVAAYGNPEGPGAGPSKQGGAWFEPSPSWRRSNLVLIPLADLPGFPTCPYGPIKGVTLHKLVAPVFLATWQELTRRGLNHKLKTFDGSVAFRHMGHDRNRPLSVHAFGAALDFDAAWNGYGVPLERMQIDRDVVRCFEECGWTWGGRWTGRYADGMHFQWTNPLQGVTLPRWQDAAATAGPEPVGVPATPLTVVPRAKPGKPRPLRDWGREPLHMSYRQDLRILVSVMVDDQGRVLFGPDGKPRYVVLTEAEAKARGLT